MQGCVSVEVRLIKNDLKAKVIHSSCYFIDYLGLDRNRLKCLNVQIYIHLGKSNTEKKTPRTKHFNTLSPSIGVFRFSDIPLIFHK